MLSPASPPAAPHIGTSFTNRYLKLRAAGLVRQEVLASRTGRQRAHGKGLPGDVSRGCDGRKEGRIRNYGAVGVLGPMRVCGRTAGAAKVPY